MRARIKSLEVVTNKFVGHVIEFSTYLVRTHTRIPYKRSGERCARAPNQAAGAGGRDLVLRRACRRAQDARTRRRGLHLTHAHHTHTHSNKYIWFARIVIDTMVLGVCVCVRARMSIATSVE